MALPTTTNLITLDYAQGGQPFVQVDAKSGIDTTTLDYAFGGQPFSGTAAATTDITLSITGNAATGAVGNLGASDSISGQADSIGNAATGAAGTLGPSVTIAITGNAGTGAAGTLGPSESTAIASNAATGAVGSTTPSIVIAISGNAAVGAAGTLATDSPIPPPATQALDGVGSGGRGRSKTFVEDRRVKAKAPAQVVEASGETEDTMQHSASADVSVILVISIFGESSSNTLQKSEGSIQSIMQIRGTTYAEAFNKSDGNLDMVDVGLHDFLLMLEDV